MIVLPEFGAEQEEQDDLESASSLTDWPGTGASIRSFGSGREGAGIDAELGVGAYTKVLEVVESSLRGRVRLRTIGREDNRRVRLRMIGREDNRHAR